MKAQHHTQKMLTWWAGQGISSLDLALRRPNGAMVWHHALPIHRLPLPWARAENAHGSEVYIRPARNWPWPLVFLDDVHPTMASRIACTYRALIIHTSQLGGCHLWLACKSSLDERTRHLVQRWLVPRAHADPASTSGDHLGRLAGFKNWKRNGQWVNVLSASTNRPPWNPPPESMIHDHPSCPPQSTTRSPATRSDVDISESGREWGWVCGALAAGIHPDHVFDKLLQRAKPRKGRHAKSYAARTVRKALKSNPNSSVSTP
jgi:hypothetical protein